MIQTLAQMAVLQRKDLSSLQERLSSLLLALCLGCFKYALSLTIFMVVSYNPLVNAIMSLLVCFFVCLSIYVACLN